MTDIKVEIFSGTRVTVKTTTSYDAVLDRLNVEIQRNWPATKSSPNEIGSISKADFERYFQTNAGPSGFLQFYSIEHDKWLKLYDIGNGRRCVRVILGNPLIAKTIMEHDLSAGLYVPVELLLLELEDKKGADVVYILPSSLIVNIDKENEKLKMAARALDDKFELLIKRITT
jgi:exonuclease V